MSATDSPGGSLESLKKARRARRDQAQAGAASADTVFGITTPRVFTPPLVVGPPGPCGCGCALTEETSEGFAVVRFALQILNHPVDAWQRWLYIHAMELLPDGRPRFRQVLVLVARQNGKTEALVLLSAYWLFVVGAPLVLGTSTKLEYAKESWQKLVKMVERTGGLDRRLPPRWVRRSNGEQECWTLPDEETGEPARYKIAASNAEGGRSLTIHRLILDELRQHHTYDAWNASVPAGNAVRDFQVWALSNAGDDKSLVLNELREAALGYIATGVGDDRLFLGEWSAHEEADPLDVQALAQANPSLGYRMELETLLSDARKAVEKGGEMLTGFRTEAMCIRVKVLNPAIDPGAWRRCLDPGDLASVRNRVALCIDVAPDGLHATAVAAAMLADGRVRVEPVGDWSGPRCTEQLRAALPTLAARIRPKVVGWFPSGPAAALAADLADRRKEGRLGWPPPGVQIEEIRGEVTAACMGFAEQVTAGRIAQSGDPLLDAHVAVAERLRVGDAWRFSRKGEGHVDALYAAAGAAHLARTLPTPMTKPKLIVVNG